MIVLAVLYFGGQSIASGSISIGDLSAFMMYSGNLMSF
jgi:ABC-type bacteriocin/lantibiotic exporter with double-glycine peptidase domain